MVWFLVRFPDNIALELVTAAHQGSDRATGFRKENGTAKLGIPRRLASKIEEVRDFRGKISCLLVQEIVESPMADISSNRFYGGKRRRCSSFLSLLGDLAGENLPR
jgi:hypothetical protein